MSVELEGDISTSTNSFSGLGLELKENENKEIDALLILAGGFQDSGTDQSVAEEFRRPGCKTRLKTTTRRARERSSDYLAA